MYQMTVRAIKRIMKNELDNHYNNACGDIKGMHDSAGRNMLNFGHDAAMQQLNDAQDYAALDTFCGEWYRMSLEDWVNSL